MATDLDIYQHIPAELRALDQWVVWRLEQRPGKTKPDKVPYRAINGMPASTTDAATWGSFDQAMEALDWDETYAGLGFVFAPDGEIFGFDADGLLDPATGEISPEARVWLDKFCTYTEVSPSGRGLHAIGHGTLPVAGKRSGPFEVYSRARFFTMTGRVIPAYPTHLAHVNGALEELCTFLDAGKQKTTAVVVYDSTDPGHSHASDAEIIKAAMDEPKHGAYFKELWHGGIARGTDTSPSAGDAALLLYLAFWCNSDAAQMDRLMRQSLRERDKWDERRGSSTWLADEIDKAIALRNGAPGYFPNKLVSLVLAGPGSDEEGADDQWTPPERNLTDLGNAQRLALNYADRLRFVPGWDWVGWNGRHWMIDASGIAERAARGVITGLYQEARRLRNQDGADDESRKEAARIASWAFASEAAKRISAMVQLARSESSLVASTEMFDADPWLLTVANGTLQLRTATLREHRREDYATRASKVVYDPTAEAPTFQAFLQKVLPDADVRAFVQRYAGYSLTGVTNEQCLAFLHGTGSNGKSTLLGVLQQVLGTFAVQTAGDTLLDKQQSGGISNDVAMLAGARMAVTIEVEDGKRLAESLVKQLTGQDPITARFMRKEFFTFLPVFKIWMAANHKPTIRGTDEAIWRRIHLVPFTVTITAEERRADPTFAQRLQTELPGILRWCVEGCLAWQRIGLAPPAAVRAATAAYREEMDVMGPFFDERCEFGWNKEVTSAMLYAAYTSWCSVNGCRPLNTNAIAEKLRNRGATTSRAHGGVRIWLGVALKHVVTPVTPGDIDF